MNEDKVLTMLLENRDAIKKLQETVGTYKEDRDNTTKTLDTLVVLAKKKDQELTILAHTVRRHEDTLEQHDRDIKQLKPLAGLA